LKTFIHFFHFAAKAGKRAIHDSNDLTFAKGAAHYAWPRPLDKVATKNLLLRAEFSAKEGDAFCESVKRLFVDRQ
jgi:hypothetical protein